MSLSVTCPDCAKSLKLKDELAGKKIRCPECSRVLLVPTADSDPEEALDVLDEVPSTRKRRASSDHFEDDDVSDSTVRSRKSTKKKSGRSKSSGTSWVLIGGGGVAGLVFLVLLAVAIFQAMNVKLVWTPFKHPSGLAQIDMPGTPIFNVDQSKNGAHTYSLAKRQYNMSVIVVAFDSNTKLAISTVPGAIDLMFREMETKAPQQIPGAVLLSSRHIKDARYRGLEMKVKVQGQVDLIRFFVVENGLIGAEFATANESAYGAERDQFFRSFKDSNGNPIEGTAPASVTTPTPGATPAAAHNSPSPDSPSGAPPTPPLSLPKPPDSPSVMNGQNLAEQDPGVLAALAHQAANSENNFAKAAQLQFWYVKKSNRGQYNLACYLSRSGQRDAALYWLQVAALDEGVDSAWATKDADMQPLWNDPRWNQVLPFLQKCNSYWSNSKLTETQLVMPAGVSSSEPIPVMIGLHGMGSSAAGFVDAETYQAIANEKRIAFLGVSGTIPRGPTSFVWSEDPVKDGTRIDAALNEVKGRLTPKEGQLVLFGFSQGAMMSAEIAARSPDRYSGALIMSPGGNSQPQPQGFQRPKNGRVQNAICICGAGEHPGNVQMTSTYANLFRQAGARVTHKPYPNLNTHSIPPDYLQQLPGWIDFLLGDNSSATKPPTVKPAPVKSPTVKTPTKKDPTTPAGKPPANPMSELRQKFLTTSAADLGIKSSSEFPRVFGVLMDWPIDNVTGSVASLSDGTASLYTTGEFGVIGGGDHASVRAAAIQFVKAAASYYDDANPVVDYPYPRKGKVRFYLLGFAGVRMLEANVADFEKSRGKLLNLWTEGQGVTTELKAISEKSNSK